MFDRHHNPNDWPTYEIVRFHWGYAIRRNNPGTAWPLWLDHVARGEYVWYHGTIHARGYSKKTAEKHLKVLQSGYERV